MIVLFWVSFGLLFYSYLGYGLLLFLLIRKRKAITPSIVDPPPITLIIPAYNEEAVIEKKIQNSLALQYPKDRLFFLFVTDGSTDATNAIIKQYPQLPLLTANKRQGKTAAINRAMSEVKTPLVAFTDANTMLDENSLLIMARHFSREEVGGVAGEKRIMDPDRSTVGLGERLYWQYESWLKKTNADFYTVIGAAGELFAIRTHLFQPVANDVILDDFVISARVCEQGYRFVYEKSALAMEAPSVSIEEERKRKIRISAGCFQALFLLRNLLRPDKNFRVAFQYFSHRVLRWTLCPVCLLLLFISNLLLVLSKAGPLYSILLCCQLLFYFFSFIGAIAAGKSRLPQALLVPYYFVFMNLSLVNGFFRFLTKKQNVLWAKAARKTA